MTENLIRRLSFLTLQLKKHNFSEKEIKLIKKAYDFAYRKHGTQTRKSGEPYLYCSSIRSSNYIDWVKNG